MDANHIRIPSKAECQRIIAVTGMLDHIVAHSRQVCRVARLLADHLGIIGRHHELIMAAALLHDITKTRSFHTSEDHARTGNALLTDLGYPEVGVVVGQHVHLNPQAPVSELQTDAQIVNYADKRVLHDRIVPLNDRMQYILEKYGNTEERKTKIRVLWKETEQLEKRLFAQLPFSPSDLVKLLPD